VLAAGSGRPLRVLRGSLGPAAMETTAAAAEAPTASSGSLSGQGTSVVVEIDGKGGAEHNWSRHF
jgi:hypothetical protein